MILHEAWQDGFCKERPEGMSESDWFDFITERADLKCKIYFQIVQVVLMVYDVLRNVIVVALHVIL